MLIRTYRGAGLLASLLILAGSTVAGGASSAAPRAQSQPCLRAADFNAIPDDDDPFADQGRAVQSPVTLAARSLVLLRRPRA
jgi:hypothetical protein